MLILKSLKAEKKIGFSGGKKIQSSNTGHNREIVSRLELKMEALFI